MRIEVNARRYRRPTARTAVVCIDGVDPDYLGDAFQRHLTPRLAELTELHAQAQLPTFTNPNNMSIVTGATAAVHGVSGNHFLASDGEAVQLVRPELLRAPTIHAAFRSEGVRTLVVTAKEKLRPLLSSGGVPCVSAELAAEQTLEGIDGPVAGLVSRPPPGIYDWDCSYYALELALVLTERLGIELLYVSLTDFVQHTAAPGDELSDRYLVELDRCIGLYLDAGWRLALVADHGMNAKPDVQYVGDALDTGGIGSARVLLPITDPYVVHHAALGSACWVYVDEPECERARALLLELPGIEEVLTRAEGAVSLAVPADRIGDLVVLADARTALGGRRGEHDLSALHGPLRSHGGRHEQDVPILLSEPPSALPAGPLRNADAHFLLLGVPA